MKHNAPSYEDLQLRIEELEANERSLTNRMTRLELAIDAAEAGIWDYDPRSGEIHFSWRWLSMLGYKPGEMSSSETAWSELIHPDDKETVNKTFGSFLQSPDPYFSCEFRMRTKDRSWMWILSRGKVVDRDEEGNVSRVVGTNLDLTDRKRLEDSLRLTQFIFERASIGIFCIGSDARILDVNLAGAERLGYSCEEMKSMSIFDINPLTNEENWMPIWERLDAGGKDRFETVHRHRDGTEFPVYIHSNLLEYEGHQFSIAFVQELTEIKKMEQALFHAQKMESIGTLAGGVAHDFNNILSAIIGYSQLAQLNSSNQEKVQEYIGNICKAGDRAKELVAQILTLSRQGESEKSPLDISVTVKEAMKLVRASIPSSIDIKYDIEENLGYVNANQTQIHQVVMNLMTNAAHALALKGGTIAVELHPWEIESANVVDYHQMPPGRYLKLSVADNGHGMASEILTRIFEPYFTTKEVGVGTGMGLATVHGIIKDHKGDIKVYSEPDVGTVFHILFPEIITKPSCCEIKKRILPRGGERVLVIDDEQSLVDIIRQLLEGLGYAVESRTDSIAAFESFAQYPERYDLIISDLTMPKMDGEKLFTKAREIRPDIPILLCTGFSKTVLSTELGEIKNSALLMKPFSACELAESVRTLLDRRI